MKKEECSTDCPERSLVPQRNQGLVSLAERSYLVQSALRLGYDHDRTIAENCVSRVGEVPRATFAILVYGLGLDRQMGRGSDSHTGK
jgi:hypothetical protein